MTTELVLLLSVYVMFIMGIFIHPEWGVVNVFNENLPRLSARVEKHISIAEGFWGTRSYREVGTIAWERPPP